MKIFCFVISFNYIVYAELRYVNLNYMCDWKIKTLNKFKKIGPSYSFCFGGPKE